MLTTDICIIGAGPVGLFAVFEAGLLKMRCHVVDVLTCVGGQLTEIYPKKPIYDIPGFKEIEAQQLVKNLMAQIEPFRPTLTLGETVTELRQTQNGFMLATSDGTSINCKAVVIAAGLGSFEPRKPDLANLAAYEGKGVSYMIKDPETFRHKKVVLVGGGDSALDWAIYLTGIASELTLIHRNEAFRGAPDSVEKVTNLAAKGRIKLLLGTNVLSIAGNGRLRQVTYVDKHKLIHSIDADYMIPLFGLSPKLGPIANWGLELEKNAIRVNVQDYSTSVSGIYAIGDINSYPGKLKLILSGFHEAALMAQSAFSHVHPNQKASFKYTTVTGITSI